MLTRTDVISALAVVGQPVTPRQLADYMGKSAAHVGNTLRELYFMRRIDRFPLPEYRARFVYRMKDAL